MYFPLRVSIPEPCHEDWHQMTPVEFNQRHCRTCDRVLTDFSPMTDVQIGSHLRRNHGKLCGRFRADQLNRKIATGGPRRFGGLRAAAAASGLMLSFPAIGQDNGPELKERLTTMDVKQSQMSESLRCDENTGTVTDSIVISGTITDENGEILPFATVYVLAPYTGTVTDLDGHYSLTVPRTKDLILEVSYTGFEDRRIEHTMADSSEVTINVQMDSGVLISEVFLTGVIISRRSLAHRIFVAPVNRYVVWPVGQLSRNVRDWREERRATRPERQAARDLRSEERRAARKLSEVEAPSSTAPKHSIAPAAAPENALNLTANPNPFTDHLNVNFYLDTPGDYQLELLSTTGQTITKQLGTALTGPQSIKLHYQTTDLPTGTYFLLLTTKEGEAEIAILIK